MPAVSLAAASSIATSSQTTLVSCRTVALLCLILAWPSSGITQTMTTVARHAHSPAIRAPSGEEAVAKALSAIEMLLSAPTHSSPNLLHAQIYGSGSRAEQTVFASCRGDHANTCPCTPPHICCSSVIHFRSGIWLGNGRMADDLTRPTVRRLRRSCLLSACLPPRRATKDSE